MYRYTEDKYRTRVEEECAELIQMICKIRRFGINDFNPETKETNVTKLIEECADVLVTIEQLDLPALPLEIAKGKKRAKLKLFEEREQTSG